LRRREEKIKKEEKRKDENVKVRESGIAFRINHHITESCFCFAFKLEVTGTERA